MIDETHKLLIRAAAFKEAANMVSSYFPSPQQIGSPYMVNNTSPNITNALEAMFSAHAALCFEEAKTMQSFNGDSYATIMRPLSGNTSVPSTSQG